MAPGAPILIAGGGIGGLTAALALAARGFSVRVFERGDGPSPSGAGIQLSPNASRILYDLGLGPALEPHGRRPERIVLRNRAGRRLAQVPLGREAERRYGTPYIVVRRADLHRNLFDAASEDGRIEIRTSTNVARFAETANAICAETDKGAFEGAALVGADGLWSRMRAASLGDGPPRASGRIAWRALVPADAAPTDLRGDETGLWLGPDAHLVHYPLGHHVNLVAVTHGEIDGEGWSMDGDAAELASRFARWAAPARDLLQAASRWQCWMLADRAPSARWGTGRATLLGDAAHPMLPFMAQGGAMAIEDAAVLAHEIAVGDAVAPSLRRYERARRVRTARLVLASRRQGMLFHLAGPAAIARDAVMRATPSPRLLARQDWIYGWRPPG